ncbi:hypothetical protein [Serratia ficaria]|uniref:hypothetical protein n=1 Tax=Serratia ficaria TaxID=61651 RepID=UPI0021C98D3A|nr:hypothetical protein [Serratia ficaria]
MAKRGFVRFAGLLAALSVATGFTRWPEMMFISCIVMLVIWLHAEFDWWKSKRED